MSIASVKTAQTCILVRD